MISGFEPIKPLNYCDTFLPFFNLASKYAEPVYVELNVITPKVYPRTESHRVANAEKTVTSEASDNVIKSSLSIVGKAADLCSKKSSRDKPVPIVIIDDSNTCPTNVKVGRLFYL